MVQILNADGHGDENEIFAFISIDEDGKSGICAATTPLGITPLIGMTFKDMEKYRPFVRRIKEETDKEIKLIRYQQVEIIEP